MSEPLDHARPDSSIPSSKPKTTLAQLMTPVRRILFRLERSKSAHQRRKKFKAKGRAVDAPPILDSNRERFVEALSPSLDPPTSSPETETALTPVVSTSDPASPKGGQGRVAIQQEDTSLDAIVVTTLPNYPFCCHEDLLGMSREELLSVARELNVRLPASSQIPVDARLSDAVVRAGIEVLVGIMPPVPMAPKAIKCAPSLNVAVDVEVVEGDGGGIGGGDIHGLRSPPSSPLAMREKRRWVGMRAAMAGRDSSGTMVSASRAGSRAKRSAHMLVEDDGSEDEEVEMSPLACISPRRFLDRLEEEDEPDSEEDEGRDNDDVDSHDGHATKRRKVSSDGRHTRILPGSCLAVVESSPVKKVDKNPMSGMGLPAVGPAFRIPRRPVRLFWEDEVPVGRPEFFSPGSARLFV